MNTYTSNDILKVEMGKDVGGGYYIINESRCEMPIMVYFKNGQKCLAYTVDGALEWMNKLMITGVAKQ